MKALLGLAAALAALALAAPTASAAPAELGVNVNRVFNDSFDSDRWALHLGGVQDAGIRMARADAFWEAAESRPPRDGVHSYDFTYLDFVAVALANHGLRWQPILDYSALWATSVPGNDHAPPRDADDYAAYAAAFARRYGRGGTAWDDYDPATEPEVTTYEIWNEPNLAHFWQPEPDAARYMELYAKARAAIKGVDPDATVLVGGLLPGTGFARAIYEVRADAAELIDGIAFHPYSRTPEGVVEEVRRLRRTLEEVGDPHAPIHITELGWVTNPPSSSLHWSDEERARNLEAAVRALTWSDCGVESVIPYTWTTPEQNPDDMEDWYGMTHPDGTPSATAQAYARVVAERAAGTPHETLRICHPPDNDGDGVPDAEDPDDDGDVVPDSGDAFPFDAAEQLDSDRDGDGDNADPDADNDGFLDPHDAFPLDPGEQRDGDADGIGEHADPDDDNDALPDAAEPAARTSAFDADSDDDGIADGAERRTDPADRDSDDDRLPDGLERGVRTGLPDGPGPVRGTKRTRFLADYNPRTKTLATSADTDRDGLTDRKEDRDRDGRRESGETDPLKRDTDRDTVADGRDRFPLNARRR